MRRILIPSVLVAASVLVANGAGAPSATLVIDNSFTIKTSDPGRAFDPTASLVDHALYDTLFTYKGGDLVHPIPLLVSSFKASSNVKTYTFQLKRNVHFADRLEGDAMTFDFRLQEGVVRHSNAIELMRAVGLEV